VQQQITISGLCTNPPSLPYHVPRPASSPGCRRGLTAAFYRHTKKPALRLPQADNGCLIVKGQKALPQPLRPTGLSGNRERESERRDFRCLILAEAAWEDAAGVTVTAVYGRA